MFAASFPGVALPNQRFQRTAPLRGASLATLGAAEPVRWAAKMLRHIQIGLLAVSFAALSGCIVHPRKLDAPVTVSGSVIYPDKTPAAGAELTFWWSGFAFPKGAHKILARIHSDEAGRFRHAFNEGPPKSLVVWSENGKFNAFVDLAEVHQARIYWLRSDRSPDGSHAS